MKFHSTAWVSCLAIMIGGCPKRQTVTRVVYTSPPPAATAPVAEASPETLVIEEPPPPEPKVEPAPEPEPTPPPKPAPRRRSTETEPATAPETGPEEPASAPVPALEPRETTEQLSDLKRRVISLQQNVQQKLAAIEQDHSLTVNAKALNDSRTFLKQSQTALQNGNVRLAMNLAEKATLLVDSAVQKP